MQVVRGNAEIRGFCRLEKHTRKNDTSSSEICRVHSSLEFLFYTQGRGFISSNFSPQALYLILLDAVITLCDLFRCEDNDFSMMSLR